MGFLPAREQLEILRKGTVDLIDETELLKKLEASRSKNVPLKIKLGADPTRPDLHLGHVVVLQKLRDFQKLGHEVIFLIGDFTATIGDPTGKSETRKALSLEEVAENAKTYAEQIFKVLDKDKTQVRYNSEWFAKMTAAEMIQLASQYTVARMLERDDFTNRYRSGTPIALHEFLYPLVQGYDSVVLKADVECGGTDQKFNLLVGRDLQKSWSQAPQCVITVPLLVGLDGVQKMSKSFGNYIALTDSPTEMFGKTMRLSDDLMLTYYELLTDMSAKELGELKAGLQSGAKHPRDVKVQLAKTFVARFHSQEAADRAEDEFVRLFRQGGLPDDLPEVILKLSDLKAKRILTDEGKVDVSLLLKNVGLAASTSEARRSIAAQSVSVDGVKVDHHLYSLSPEPAPGAQWVFKVGKKKFAKVLIGEESMS